MFYVATFFWVYTGFKLDDAMTRVPKDLGKYLKLFIWIHGQYIIFTTNVQYDKAQTLKEWK